MSVHEGLQLAAAEQQVIVEGYAILQAKLGVSEEVARELARVEVVCPFKNQDGINPKQSLGELVVSEHAAESTAVMLDVAREEIDAGESHDRALRTALGATAVSFNKETGKLATVAAEAEPVTATTEVERAALPSVAEPLKKN